ncbi:MAG: baseplate J/gp47 family protein [Anaerolineae bacterium]
MPRRPEGRLTVEILRITQTDDRYTVREALRRTSAQRILLVLPWEVENGWDRPLDYEVLFRTAQREQMDIAWAVDDPFRRDLPREAGFPVFAGEADAEAYLADHESFPSPKPPAEPAPPRTRWWQEEPKPEPVPLPTPRPWWRIVLQIIVLITVLLTLGGAIFLALPSAQVRLYPSGAVYSVIVPISVDPDLENGQVDLQRNLIPARRVGDEFEGYAEVAATGRGVSFTGRSSGSVVFTNLLGQDYNVPEGTVVRTSAGSYPVRFETTAQATVPAFGQVEAPVQALEEGPRGNVDPYQINFVEGVAGFALKVTNPRPISGAESEEVATVSEADQDRVWDLAAQQALAEAFNALQQEPYLEPNEFLPRQTLVIQAVPKEAYTHLVGEKSDTLGLTLRLLVTGQAVNTRDVQAVAFRELSTYLPEGYILTDTRFEIGESAEEDVGPGIFTFYVHAHGYATSDVNTKAIRETIRGERIEEAEARLEELLPLARPPEIEVQPDWFPFVPRLEVRTDIEVVPGTW